MSKKMNKLEMAILETPTNDLTLASDSDNEDEKHETEVNHEITGNISLIASLSDVAFKQSIPKKKASIGVQADFSDFECEQEYDSQ